MVVANTLAYYGTATITALICFIVPDPEPTQVKHLQVPHAWVGSWPYPQTLDWGGKACRGATTLAYYDHL